MLTSRLLRSLVLLTVFLIAAPLQARDWFVRAGSSGDGSQASPFGDPFQALDKCEAGDSIHIAEGRYTGKLDSGEWQIPFDNITLLGGYTADFSERNPWTHHSMLVWDKNNKNKPTDERILSNANNTTIDGLTLDGVEQNEYDDTGRTPKDLDHATAMIRFATTGTLRNCILINTGREGLVCGAGSTIENNLFMNTFTAALKINSVTASKAPAIVKNNTFLWVWDDRAPGTGHDEGNAIYMTGPAVITNNIFGHNDNAGIYATINLEKTTIADNVYFMNLYANLRLFMDGKDVSVDDKTMDLFDEAGLKNAEGNLAKNPGMDLDKDWMSATIKRTASEPGKVTMDDWNQLRQALGEDLHGTGGKPASGIAPAYSLDKALALLTPKDSSVKAGARVLKLEVKFSGNTAAAPEKSYEKSDLAKWASDPDSVNGKALEMTVAITNVTNISGIPALYKQDDHEGIAIYDPTGENHITGFYKKGSTVNRFVGENSGRYDGTGKPTQLFTVKGIAVVSTGYPKAAFYIEAMTAIDAAANAAKKVPGRDWFVKAGASGGDGSKEKPFKDPFQALEKCEAGDTLHVTGGDYVGKLHAGVWKIDCPNITMLGGYSSDFSSRDPWKNPTLLYCPADFKGNHSGYTLEGTDDHSNFVLDGFVFDKKGNNKYKDSGDLLPSESDHTPHVRLTSPGCVVRNCLFMNGAEGALEVTGADTVENCIFLNHYSHVLVVEPGKTPEIPAIIKNNTFAFAWEERFGSGHGITADLLILHGQTHAVVDNNIFEFADQHAIRLETEPKFVELTNNVFAHNLWAEVFQTQTDLVIDNKNFDKLTQLDWKKVEGNQLVIPGLPLDQKWFDVYLNRTAYVEGKVTMDDWNQARELLGQPMIATGGKSAEGMAPAYDRTSALSLFPKNPKVTAGARDNKLEVKFEGIARAAETHDYTDAAWDDVQSADNWAKLNGKRIALKVVITRDDNQYTLDDIKQENFAAWNVESPQGSDGNGLPIRVYVPKGTRTERMFNQAPGYSSGPVNQTHIIKGIVRDNRQLVVEAAEKAD